MYFCTSSENGWSLIPRMMPTPTINWPRSGFCIISKSTGTSLNAAMTFSKIGHSL